MFPNTRPYICVHLLTSVYLFKRFYSKKEGGEEHHLTPRTQKNMESRFTERRLKSKSRNFSMLPYASTFLCKKRGVGSRSTKPSSVTIPLPFSVTLFITPLRNATATVNRYEYRKPKRKPNQKEFSIPIIRFLRHPGNIHNAVMPILLPKHWSVLRSKRVPGHLGLSVPGLPDRSDRRSLCLL